MRLVRQGGVALAALVFVSQLVACNRPNREQCEQLCRRYAELSYFEKAEKRAAGDQVELEEAKKRWEEMQTDDLFLKHLENCMTGCRFEGGTKEMAACVADADTADKVRACMED